jgi:hypothetical protein
MTMASALNRRACGILCFFLLFPTICSNPPGLSLSKHHTCAVQFMLRGLKGGQAHAQGGDMEHTGAWLPEEHDSDNLMLDFDEEEHMSSEGQSEEDGYPPGAALCCMTYIHEYT